MRFAIVSGIVTEEAPVSYWPFFLVPEVFAKVNSSQFSLFLQWQIPYHYSG